MGATHPGFPLKLLEYAQNQVIMLQPSSRKLLTTNSILPMLHWVEALQCFADGRLGEAIYHINRLYRAT